MNLGWGTLLLYSSGTRRHGTLEVRVHVKLTLPPCAYCDTLELTLYFAIQFLHFLWTLPKLLQVIYTAISMLRCPGIFLVVFTVYASPRIIKVMYFNTPITHFLFIQQHRYLKGHLRMCSVHHKAKLPANFKRLYVPIISDMPQYKT